MDHLSSNILKICLLMMALSGTDPRKMRSKFQFPFWILNILSLFIVILRGCVTLILNEGLDINLVSGIMDCIFLVTHAATNLMTLYLKMPKLKTIQFQINQFWNIDDFKNNEDMVLIKNRLRNFTYFFKYFVVFGGTTVSVGYLYKPYFTKSRVLVYDGVVPTNDALYYILLAVETYSIWLTGLVCIAFDLYFATIVTLTSMQFRMLGIEFRNVIEMENRNADDKIKIRNLLKKCIDHHNLLLNLVNSLNQTICVPLVVYLADLVLSMCIELFIMTRYSNRDLFKMVQIALYVTCLLNEFIRALCITGQNLTNEAEEMLNIINTSNWYENSAITKNDFLIITLEAQRPVRLSAGKFININLATCMATYKTIFSYYMFLLSVSESES